MASHLTSTPERHRRKSRSKTADQQPPYITALHRIRAAFAGPDADRLFDVRYENLAVADLVGPGGALNRFDGTGDESIFENDLDPRLRQKVDDVFGAAIDLGVAALPAKSADLADGHTGHAQLIQ